MSNEAEHPRPSHCADGGPVSAPLLADASTAADNPAENTRCDGKHRKETLSRLQVTGVVLELVGEDGDNLLDLKAAQQALAIVLVRYYRKVQSERLTRDMT
ncbi:MAG: hypothetical protein WEG40_15585 [Candidatus Rokuibacteriota bacterium]